MVKVEVCAKVIVLNFDNIFMLLNFYKQTP